MTPDLILNHMDSVALEVITGCMWAGKSRELIRRLHLAEIAGLHALVVKPLRDTRDGETFEAVVVASAADILSHVHENHEVIGIDETHFFDEGLIDVVRELIARKKRVIASGLNLDWQAIPFNVTAHLMALASNVSVLTAVCTSCRSFHAVRSQRIAKSTDRILPGDADDYQPRCLACFEVASPVLPLSKAAEGVAVEFATR